MIDDSQLVQQLLETGLIDHDRLREGIKLHKQNGGTLYETLVWNRVVDERKLVDVVAKMLNVPSVQLSRIEIHRKVLDLVPGQMASRNRVIPLQVRDEGGSRQLILGMADPIDVLAMDEIATHTGIDIRPVLVGPLEIAQVLKTAYKPAPDETDDLLAGLDQIAADVLDDQNWADFFDDAIDHSNLVEDSSVISRDMRDRPTTDVFDAVDEAPSLDELDMGDLNDPVSEHHSSDGLADLEDWDIDDAITNNHSVSTNSTRAEILSAVDAESLFGPSGGQYAKIQEPDGDKQIPEATDDVGEPTMKKSVAELTKEPEPDDTGNIGNTGKTRVGIGVNDLSPKGGEALRGASTEDSDLLDNTGKTQAGVGARIHDKSASKPAKRSTKKKDEATDYGALGLQILKSSTDTGEDDAVSRDDVEGVEDVDDVDDVDTGVKEAVDDAKTNIRAPIPRAAKLDPATREIEENDLIELANELDLFPDDPLVAEPVSPEIVAAPSGFVVPEGLEQHVVLAAVTLLVERGILNADELLALARTLKGS